MTVIPGQCCLLPRTFVFKRTPNWKTFAHPERFFITKYVQDTDKWLKFNIVSNNTRCKKEILAKTNVTQKQSFRLMLAKQDIIIGYFYTHRCDQEMNFEPFKFGSISLILNGTNLHNFVICGQDYRGNGQENQLT